MRRQASNIKSLKSDNRSLILNEIRKQPCSRVQLSYRTNLTRSAVTMIVQELITEGQVRQTQALQSGRGRRQILLDIVPDYRLAAGISLHRHELTVVLTDLKGFALEQKSAPTSEFQTLEQAADWVRITLIQLLQAHQVELSHLAGIGISSPGPLDLTDGRILEPIEFPLFRFFDVVDTVREWFLDKEDGRSVAQRNLPVSLENNAVLLAVREFYHEKSSIHHFRQILYVTISQGIGSCIINDGVVYRGSGGFAGELGHTSIDGAGRPCSCGNFGCIERYATLRAICDYFSLDNFDLTVDLAYSGQSRSLAILEQVADWLSTALINAVNLFDVDAIVLYGELNYRPRLLADLIQSRIRQRSLVGRTHGIVVLPSVFDDKDAALASTAAVIDHHFKPNLDDGVDAIQNQPKTALSIPD